jgi:hypothetical protein
MPAKRDFPKTKSHNVFGQARKPAEMFWFGLSKALVSAPVKIAALRLNGYRSS